MEDERFYVQEAWHEGFEDLNDDDDDFILSSAKVKCFSFCIGVADKYLPNRAIFFKKKLWKPFEGT